MRKNSIARESTKLGFDKGVERKKSKKTPTRQGLHWCHIGKIWGNKVLAAIEGLGRVLPCVGPLPFSKDAQNLEGFPGA